MTSKTICVREEIFKRLNAMKKKNESFSDFFGRLLSEIYEKENNHDIIMKEVFGCARNLPDEIFTQFAKLRTTIDDDLQVKLNARI
jgi:predicted CopG family antitoxin